jgi:hypothetical protein
MSVKSVNAPDGFSTVAVSYVVLGSAIGYKLSIAVVAAWRELNADATIAALRDSMSASVSVSKPKLGTVAAHAA